MFDVIEEFCKRYEHTIAAFEAAGVLATVIVALWAALLSIRASRTELTATAAIRFIVHSTIPDRPTYLTVLITNKGLMQFNIPLTFFYWKMPFRGGSWFITPHDYSAADRNVPQQKYPVAVPPKSTATFFLSKIEMFRESTVEKVFSERSILNRWRFPFMRAFVVTEDGAIFKVKLEDGLKKELKKLRQEAK